MPRKSQTENVRKICGCAKWKTCSHPWYVDYREGKEVDPKTCRVRPRGLRKQLRPLVGREPSDYADAVNEARRAIVAWQEGRDPKGLIPSDEPTLAQVLPEYDREKPRQDRWQIGRITSAKVGGTVFGQLRVGTITADTLKAFRRTRPLVAGNRDLALLRAAFNWAVLSGLMPRSPFRVGDVPAVRLAREEARSRHVYSPARNSDSSGQQGGCMT